MIYGGGRRREQSSGWRESVTVARSRFAVRSGARARWALAALRRPLAQGFSPALDVACIASRSAFMNSSGLCDRDRGTSMCTAGARFALIGRVYFYDRRSLSSWHPVDKVGL
ncbi:hypothetical protein HETIRDRAFT_108633 [Heterobasidion irregulare TC 32-1]|uniref:Uncharacterized protein n=1 Tax=Heterobasidion irregulare (strain TC 32-1) TaxID=747525 RepID=W4JP11_HETIT|nr:uncharacterized protein HETIRDRAFT_108633 [Heterobasidion irregulare TC 32-1]ETW74626.1 hypothetical protein HETIRDRAFT_108633 [Heterobasidion irregulare TC 32-1]